MHRQVALIVALTSPLFISCTEGNDDTPVIQEEVEDIPGHGQGTAIVRPRIPCSLEDKVDGVLIKCGTDELLVRNGRDGVDGSDGKDGTQGRDGVDGTDGLDAAPSYLLDPCKRAPRKVDMSKDYYGLSEMLLVLGDGKVVGVVSQKGNGSGYPALAEVVIDWAGGWSLGGRTGTQDCTFQFREVDGVKLMWHPHTAQTPTDLTASNVTIIK